MPAKSKIAGKPDSLRTELTFWNLCFP